MRHKWPSESGFSLVQVLIATAMAAGLSLAVMQIQETATKTQVRMNYQQELNSIVTEIQTELSIKENCSATIKDHILNDNLDGLYEGKIRNVPHGLPVIDKDLPIYTVGTPIGSTGIKIDKIVFHKVLIGRNPDIYKDAISVTFDSGSNKKMFGARKVIRHFFVTVTENLKECYSESGVVVQAACESIGATWSDLTGKCNVDNIYANNCRSMGGVWKPNTKKCSLEDALPACTISTDSSCPTFYPNRTKQVTLMPSTGSETTCTTRYHTDFPGACGIGSLDLTWATCMKKNKSCTCTQVNCTCRNDQEDGWIIYEAEQDCTRPQVDTLNVTVCCRDT